MKWAYGVTTVKQRETILAATLKSLAGAGFQTPRLFIDGRKESCPTDFWFTQRCPKVGALGNWILGMWELYLRDPLAERYAMFQDDLITSRNVRQYLEACAYPAKGYLNLFTAPENHDPIEAPANKFVTHQFYNSDQKGRGAVAIVFSREALIALLSQPYLVQYVASPGMGLRGVGIDGAVLTAMRNAGYSEYVHNPSLVQHVGDVSTMGNMPHAKAPSFRGEEFDCLTLLQKEAAV
jgi:hypothetical protein